MKRLLLILFSSLFVCSVAAAKLSADEARVKRASRALSKCLIREAARLDDRVSPISEIAKAVVASKKCNPAFDRVLSAFPGGEKERRRFRDERDALLEEQASRQIRNIRDTREHLLNGWE